MPPEGYAVFGSGPLAVRGIIPLTNDLDVICLEDVWSSVSVRGAVEYLPAYDVTIATLCNGNLGFGRSWGIGDFNVEQLIATAELIDGLPFVRLGHVIRYKQIRSSAKDLQHLEAFRQYQQRNQTTGRSSGD